MLTSLIGEGAREVAAAKNRRQANRIIDAVIGYARRRWPAASGAGRSADPADRVADTDVADTDVAADAGSAMPATAGHGQPSRRR